MMFFLPLAALAFMGQMCGTSETAQTVEKATFSDAEISFDYPAAWTEDATGTDTLVVLTAPNGRDNMNVISVDLSPSPMTLEEFSDLSIEGIEQAIPGYSYVRDGGTTMAGLPAHEIVFTATKDGEVLKFWQVWTIAGNTAYALTFTAAEDNFGNLKPKVQGIVDSFKIKKQQ